MKTCPLGDVIDTSRSGFASGKRADDGVVQLRMNNVSTDGALDLTSFIRVPATEKQVSELSLTHGDVLFNCTNSAELVGKTCLFKNYPEPVVFSNHFVRLRTKRDVLLGEFLARWLAWTRDRGVFTHGCVKWVNQATYKKTDLLKLQIPLPPLAEQERIAGILDAADALRAKRRESLAQLDTLLQSTFLEMFGDPVANPMGWETRTLGEIIKVKSGNGLVAKDMAPGGEFPVYGGNGVNGYHDAYMFEEPKIILGRVGVYCGVVHLTKPKAWVTDNALYVHELLQPIDTTFLIESLKVANLNQYASQAAQPLISGGRIYPVAIPLPPLDLQHRFAAIVESVEQQKASQRAHLEELDTLFASLQSRAFQGEL